MIKVLIAEDEMLVRVGLKNAIEWNRFGMTVIADVVNGQEAWEVYEREAPDLIITDIKMPVMDGMELIARIRKTDQTTKFVILTCMEEFELVRKALVYHVSEYILKLEMTTEQIGGLLSRLQMEIKEVSQIASQPLKIEQQEVVKESLFKDYLFCNRYTEQEFSEKVAYFRMNLQPQRIIVAVMEIDQHYRLRKRFQDRKGQLIRMSLLNALGEVLRGYERGEVFYDEESRYVFVFSFHDVVSEQEILQQLYKIIDHIHKAMTTYFNVTVTFGISNIQIGYGAMKRQYDESVKALEHKFFYGLGKNVAVKNLNNELEWRQKLRELPAQWDVGASYRKKLAEKMEDFLRKNDVISKQQVKTQFMQWLLWPLVSLRLDRINVEEIFALYAERFMNAETFDETVAIYQQYLQELVEHHANKRPVSKEVNDVLQYIDNHYGRDITLEELAEYVQMSPNYLSSLFKKETHQNFADYVVQYRIEKAKELLLGTYLKTYEVADRVGFVNHSYFSRSFKKITGVSPREFRKQWLVDWSKDGEWIENESTENENK